MSSAATISDVARTAGVSVGTVSRVINGYTNITPENLEKVQNAIAALGYRKSHGTGPLVRRRSGSLIRTGNIGVLYTEMGPGWANHPLSAAYAQGIEEACLARGYHALSEILLDPQTLPRCLRERKVDGLLVKATRKYPDILRDLPPDFPVVGLSFTDPTSPVAKVAPDNRGAGFIVAEYLWKKGHRRIAFFSTDSLHPMFVARFQGYEEFMRIQDAFDPGRALVGGRPVVKNSPETTPPDVEQELDALLACPPSERPTAIVTANDWIAKGLYAALARRGLRVPDDVSVVGFDNSEPLCDLMAPPLTSYAIPFTAAARTATLALIDRIEKPGQRHEPGIQLVSGALVERQSVRPLPPVATPPLHP